MSARKHISIRAGRRATDVNGTTSFDRTNYFETMPSNQLELALGSKAIAWASSWKASTA